MQPSRLSGRLRAVGARAAPRTSAVLIRVGGLALVLLVASIIGYKLGWFNYRNALRQIEHIRQSHGTATFMICSVIVYGVGTSVGFPGLPFTVAAGVLFGTVLGSALSWMGALIGAVIGYSVARTVGRDIVLRWVKRYKRIDAAVADSRDFDGMLRLRLIPVLPLGTVNFVAGLARAPIRPYLAATAVGVIPATVIYTYFADSLLAGVGSGRRKAWISLLIASVLLIALSLTPKLLSRRKASSD